MKTCFFLQYTSLGKESFLHKTMTTPRQTNDNSEGTHTMRMFGDNRSGMMFLLIEDTNTNTMEDAGPTLNFPLELAAILNGFTQPIVGAGPPPQLDFGGNAMDADTNEAITRSLAQHRPSPEDTTRAMLDSPDCVYSNPDAIVHTCDTCKKQITSKQLFHNMKCNSFTCSCGNTDLVILNDLVLAHIHYSYGKLHQLCVNSTHSLTPPSIHTHNETGDEDGNEKEEEILQLFRKTYNNKESSNTQKECSIPFCEGSCVFVKCCPKHYMHADCLLDYIIKAESENCPVCRDAFLPFVLRKINLRRCFAKVVFGTSPYSSISSDKFYRSMTDDITANQF